MAATESADDTHTEACFECEADTPHSVEVRIVQEGSGPYSNEPYRVAECNRCGTTKTRRMNSESPA